jgi:hypothetical protein
LTRPICAAAATVLRRSVVIAGAALVLLAPQGQAAFPGQNGKIAYERDGDIWSMNPDGTAQANLTNTPDAELQPEWSPDGTKIAFVRAEDIWVMQADGTGAVNLTSGLSPFGSENYPAWSPDGTQIAFGGCCDPPGLYVMEADGTEAGVTYEPHNPPPPGELNWSPDGGLIAFAEAPSADHQIRAVQPDGGGVVVLWNPNFETIDGGPSWSPDGRRVVFYSRSGHDDPMDGLYTVDRDGSGATNLISGEQLRETAWSPDGRKIAVRAGSSNCPPDPTCGIKTLNADGSGLSGVLAPWGSDPDWQPIPVNSYPRPKGATPFRASLTIAYEACTASDRTHGPPLAFPSCASPQQTSDHLTVGTADANAQPALNEGFVRFDVQAGVPGGPDDADVGVQVFMDDVFTKPGLGDYTGELSARVALQITDKDNTPHPGGPGAATTTSIPLTATATCTATAATNEGSTCTAATSLDALVPGTVKEGRRSIWQLGRVELYDGGSDGDAQTPAGDTLFATQGVFVP